MHVILENKLVRAMIIVVSSILGVMLLFYCLSYALYWLAPFIVGLLLANLANPVVGLLHKNLKIPRKIASFMVVALIALLTASVFIFIFYQLFFELKDLVTHFPKYKASFEELFLKGKSFYLNLPPELTNVIKESFKESPPDLNNSMSDVLPQAASYTWGRIKAFPSTLVFFIITFLATFFFSSDREKIYRFVKKQFSERTFEKIRSVRDDMFGALFGYIKAQLILMSITFVELFIGFNILHIKYTLLLALLISFVDALPIFGTGGVLIPWAIFCLITGNMPLFVGLLTLYGICYIVRQLLEPKVLSSQIGLYPLVTLMSMYVGLKIMGVGGMIVGPIMTLLLLNLHRNKVITLFKE